MASLPWISYLQRMVGRGHPTLADTLNTPLRTLLSQSGYDPDADVFPGLYGPVVNGMAFGMTGLGVSPEDSALLAAVAKLPTKGGTILLPPGDLLLSSSFNQTYDATGKKKITLQGWGLGVTRIISQATTTPGVVIGGTANDLHHSLVDLDVLQSGNVLPSSARTGNFGIRLTDTGSPGAIVRNVRTRYFGDAGIQLEGGHGPIALENVEVQSCSAYGIQLAADGGGIKAQDVAIRGGNLQFCWGGVHLDGAKSTHIEDIDIELATFAQLPAVQVDGAATGNTFTNITASVAAVPSSAALIHILSGSGNLFTGGLFVVTVGGVDLIFCDTGNASWNTFISGFWESVTPGGGYYATITNGSRNTFITPKLGTFTAGKNVVNDTNGGNICIGVGTAALASDYGISIPGGGIRQGGTTLAAFTAGNNNDYALPVDYATYRVQADAGGTSVLTGIIAGAPYRRIRLINVSAFNLTLSTNDAGSAAANRLRSPTGANIVLGGNDIADLEYDPATALWRICSVLT